MLHVLLLTKLNATSIDTQISKEHSDNMNSHGRRHKNIGPVMVSKRRETTHARRLKRLSNVLVRTVIAHAQTVMFISEDQATSTL